MRRRPATGRRIDLAINDATLFVTTLACEGLQEKEAWGSSERSEDPLRFLACRDGIGPA